MRSSGQERVTMVVEWGILVMDKQTSDGKARLTSKSVTNVKPRWCCLFFGDCCWCESRMDQSPYQDLESAIKRRWNCRVKVGVTCRLVGSCQRRGELLYEE